MLGSVFFWVLLGGLWGSTASTNLSDIPSAIVAPESGTEEVAGLDFGDDEGIFANDGECDDPRFAGQGMGAPGPDHVGHDATDCRAALEAGDIHVQEIPTESGTPVVGIVEDGIDFGDDGSTWSNDGECDDPRFSGSGMTSTPLLDEDIRHDATDCRAGWDAGNLTLFEPVGGPVVVDGVDFGDDSGDWVNDNQCDDPRFEGEAMAAQPMAANESRDASDCAAAWRAGNLTLDPDYTQPEQQGSSGSGGASKISNTPGQR